MIKFNRRITLWVFIGLLFVATLFLTFKAGTVGSVETVQAIGGAVKSSSGIVGGC